MMAEKQELKAIVRLIDRDIEGKVPIRHALSKVKGVGFMMANAICNVLKLDPSREVGYFTSEELAKIEKCARHPEKYGIPSWLYNRRKDIDTGKDIHLISGELELSKKFDIRRMQKIKSYKGVRHSIGAKKVRGQRTKTGARKRRAALGVKRKKK